MKQSSYKPQYPTFKHVDQSPSINPFSYFQEKAHHNSPSTNNTDHLNSQYQTTKAEPQKVFQKEPPFKSTNIQDLQNKYLKRPLSKELHLPNNLSPTYKNRKIVQSSIKNQYLRPPSANQFKNEGDQKREEMNTRTSIIIQKKQSPRQSVNLKRSDNERSNFYQTNSVFVPEHKLYSFVSQSNSNLKSPSPSRSKSKQKYMKNSQQRFENDHFYKMGQIDALPSWIRSKINEDHLPKSQNIPIFGDLESKSCFYLNPDVLVESHEDFNQFLAPTKKPELPFLSLDFKEMKKVQKQKRVQRQYNNRKYEDYGQQHKQQQQLQQLLKQQLQQQFKQYQPEYGPLQYQPQHQAQYQHQHQPQYQPRYQSQFQSYQHQQGESYRGSRSKKQKSSSSNYNSSNSIILEDSERNYHNERLSRNKIKTENFLPTKQSYNDHDMPDKYKSQKMSKSRSSQIILKSPHPQLPTNKPPLFQPSHHQNVIYYDPDAQQEKTKKRAVSSGHYPKQKFFHNQPINKFKQKKQSKQSFFQPLSSTNSNNKQEQQTFQSPQFTWKGSFKKDIPTFQFNQNSKLTRSSTTQQPLFEEKASHFTNYQHQENKRQISSPPLKKKFNVFSHQQ